MKYIPTIKRKVDPKIWKNPSNCWEDLAEIYKSLYEMRIPFGINFKVLCPPDPRDVAKKFLRRGRLLEKDEKKRLRINPNTIVGDIVFQYFTDFGLRNCLRHTLDLTYTMAAKIHALHEPGCAHKIPPPIPLPGEKTNKLLED